MIDHLTPDTWAVVNRALVRKALSEFIHERLLEPVALTTVTRWGATASRPGGIR